MQNYNLDQCDSAEETDLLIRAGQDVRLNGTQNVGVLLVQIPQPVLRRGTDRAAEFEGLSFGAQEDSRYVLENSGADCKELIRACELIRSLHVLAEAVMANMALSNSSELRRWMGCERTLGDILDGLRHSLEKSGRWHDEICPALKQASWPGSELEQYQALVRKDLRAWWLEPFRSESEQNRLDLVRQRLFSRLNT